MNSQTLSHFYRTYGVRVVLVLLAVFLLTNTWFSIKNISRIIECEQQVADSRQILEQIQMVGALTVDLETAYRGFILSDQTKYLEPMERARAHLPQAVSWLVTLTAGNTVQHQKIKTIELLIKENVELSQTIIQNRKKAKGISKDLLTAMNRGKDLMDHIRHLLDEVTMIEEARLTQLQAEARTSADQTIWFFVFMLVLSFLFLGLGFVQLEKNRETRLALAVYADKLEKSNHELQEFVHVIAHDLKEPIRMMVAYSSLLKDELGKALPSGAEDSLFRIQDGARRMGVLVDDLVQLSRVTTQAKPFEQVDLSVVLHDVQTDLEMRLKECGGVLEVGPLPHLEADAAQMHQLFQNLIGNSLKYRQADKAPVIRVESETNLAAGEAHIWVRDNGIGFDQSHAEKIFNIFQRLHPRDKYEGTGIGLAICRKVVERHHGVISAQSKVGEGSTFEIILPLRQKA
ncbi:MAG TPA: CHASE3 domain-containing protein [bacterium]|jgi:signal transduction histidine kinase|nr:CHASE3 domain-containing protein [bacterium]